jgi:hypothetical protein
MIQSYVSMIDGIDRSFSHFLYVVKKDRLGCMERKVWAYIMDRFTEEMKQHSSVVVCGSGADEEWIDKNIKTLQSTFKGCESFLSADFPAIDEKDEELEIAYRVLRKESLIDLEKKLAKLVQHEVPCKYRRSSTAHRKSKRELAYIDPDVEWNESQLFLREASMLFRCWSNSRRPLSQPTSPCKVNDKITLPAEFLPRLQLCSFLAKTMCKVMKPGATQGLEWLVGISFKWLLFL